MPALPIQQRRDEDGKVSEDEARREGQLFRCGRNIPVLRRGEQPRMRRHGADTERRARGGAP